MSSNQPSPRPFARTVIGAIGLALSTTTLLVATSVTAQAEATVSPAVGSAPDAFGFSLSASADAVMMEVRSGLFGSPFPGIPPEEPPLSGSAAHTEVVYDDLGNNRALASAPYPGSFAVGFPGLLRGVSRPGGQPGIGQAPPLPNWPFIVTSDYPGREKSAQVNGPYGITASSDPAGSQADAHAGAANGAALLSPAAHSNATWDSSSGRFVARADSSFDLLSLAGVLELADVHSHVTLTAAPGVEEPERSSSFRVGTMKVGDVTVGLTDKGFVVGPSATPRPDLAPLEPVLSAAGMKVEFLPEETTPNSVVSAGMRISLAQTFPVQGPVTETWTVGRVAASLDAGDSYGAFSAYGFGEPSSSPAASGAAEDHDCPTGAQRFGSECYPNVAVVTPTLGFVSFGATFGGPIMCFLATGAVQSIGRGAGATAVANDVGKQATPYCTSGPNQFGEGIAQVAKALGPLTAVNPVVNPVLDSLADGFRSGSSSLGPTIAPFGPTAAEMGAFIEFFKGS